MKVKRTKAEQTQQTRRMILDRARQLFAAQGYAATGTEEIIQDLGITRGALYHQFGDKRGLFKAVVAEAFTEMTAYIITQTQTETEAWAQLVVGCQAFLEIARQGDLRRLIFVEAPAVLEADTLAEFDQEGFGLLQAAIETVVQTGKLAPLDAEGFAYLVNGALNELAVWVAQNDDPARLKTAQALVETLLTLHASQPASPADLTTAPPKDRLRRTS